MTPEELGRMTLADLEAAATRFGAAVATIREAQSLLGAPVHAVAPAIQSAPVVAQIARPANFFTATEQAEKARLLQQFKPEDIEAMERP